MSGQEFLTIVLPAIVAFVVTWVVIIWFLLKMNKKEKLNQMPILQKNCNKPLHLLTTTQKPITKNKKHLPTILKNAKAIAYALFAQWC